MTTTEVSKPVYFVVTEVKFPNINLECTVSYSTVTRTPEVFVKNQPLIDQILATEFKIPKDDKDKLNIKYKFVSLPEIAMSDKWTGSLTNQDWWGLHNKEIHIGGSFKFSYRDARQSTNTIWHTIDIHCINATIVL